MSTRTPIAALVVLGGLGACQAPPSYELRWQLEGKGSPSAAACADSGLFQIRARAYTAPNVFVDERIYPCASADLAQDDGTVPGAALSAGSYAIELRGLDRASQPWDDPEGGLGFDPGHNGCNPVNDYTECRPNERVCDCLRLVVDPAGSSTLSDAVTVVTAEGQTASEPLVFTIDPPRECEDGIDNDLDGRIDAGDPSCVVAFADGTESVPVGITDFELSISLLGRNPAAVCSSVPQFSRVQLRLDRPGEDPVVLLDEPCQLGTPYRFSALLPPGLNTFSVVGIDGGSGGVPSTRPYVFEQELSSVGNLVRQQIDFGPDDFLEPIEGNMIFSLGYRLGVGTIRGPNANERVPVPPRFSCTATAGQGRLDVTDLRLRMTNGHGGPLESPVRLDDGSALDGATLLPCSNGMFLTERVDWTEGYLLTAEALSGEGEVCFRREGIPMRPGELSALELPRVYDDDGNVPPSCLDCAVDADCNVDTFGEAICVPAEAPPPDAPDDFTPRGICHYPCQTDLQCQPEVVGDRFACVMGDDDDFGVCR